jgi:hypothetical protein
MIIEEDPKGKRSKDWQQLLSKGTDLPKKKGTMEYGESQMANTSLKLMVCDLGLN